MYGFIWSCLKEFCIVPADSRKGPANGTQLVFRVSPEPATLTFLARKKNGAVRKWGTNKPLKFVLWSGKIRISTILDLGWDHFRTNSSRTAESLHSKDQRKRHNHRPVGDRIAKVPLGMGVTSLMVVSSCSLKMMISPRLFCLYPQSIWIYPQ